MASKADPRSDYQLIRDANRGEVGAFEALYHRHRDWAVMLGWRLSGRHGVALDLMQESFFYALKKVPNLSTESKSFRAFLYEVIEHLAKQQLQRLHTGERLLDAVLEARAERAQANTKAGHNPFNDPKDELAAVLCELTDEQRQMILLRFVDGFTIEEIVHFTELPMDTVTARLRYALERLRRDDRTRRYFV
jgi:RNA polymerase sigma-70 factor (ECF subfamily)